MSEQTVANEETEVSTETRVFVDDETFISTWEQAGSKADVADALGMKPASVDQRARQMRKYGVNLKEFPKHLIAFSN